MEKFPDWITAVSTALTAVAAIGAGIVAFIGYKRDGQPPLPVIEPTFLWMPPLRGRFIRLDIIARNQLYETIILDSIRIVRPRGMTFATEKQRQLQEPPNTRTRIEKTSDVSRRLEWEIAPIGETATHFRGSQFEMTDRTDVHERLFYLSPPEGWDGGIVRIELKLLSKALTIRPRRITIKRQITVAPKMQTEANASSDD